ncbi:MAG: chromosomal replication initiator protein DnaA [Syntrophales bacterium]|nr:chromosomal replication initiator protein DnaA [Syntrophales bacterium]
MLIKEKVLEEIWDKAVELIRDNMNKSHFETWIRPLRLISVDQERLALAVPNRFFRDWIMDHYIDTIRESVKKVAGRSMIIDLEIATDQETVSAFRQRREAPPAVKAGRSTPASRPHPTLNTNYSFDRFVVGSSNQFAHAAAVAVAENPARNYNPLFIYGGVGLGKTHLINAIGLHTLGIHPQMNVVYISAEAFMNEMINCIRYDRMQQFRDKYRHIDCLLIDDVQFIAGKERTQEEFFHTFNSLHDAGKQIVVTSDKFPKEIPNLEGRLRSRFEWGLIADIQPPETETKVAIIKKKTQENKVEIPDNVAYYIATHSESNIREIEGLLLRVVAYASLKQRPIDIELVKEVLRDVISRSGTNNISIDQIIKTVAARMEVKVNDIKSPKKNKNIALARQICMYMSRKLTDASFPDIGEKIGGRDHSTVIHACHKMQKLTATDLGFKRLLEEVEEAIRNRS